MSTEETAKDESEMANKLQDGESKQQKDKKNRKEKVKPFAKVVIRRLPPTMTEEEFAKQIDPIPDHDYFYFVPADWSLGVNATCRAYINFCNHDDIFIFRDKFDGYVFVDNKGSEYPAIVEFAPFQGLPKGKSRKKDLKSNTIETEPHFLAFLESLKDEEAEGKNELKMEYSFQLRDDQKITSTPLLEYLANVRQERRDERKRKIEDRKRLREEEKQRKKNQLAKSMPKTIDEDARENDDGIVVRTIKSRPLDRDRNKNDANKADKADKSENSSRVEREKARKHERRARRREARDRNRKDGDKEDKRDDTRDDKKEKATVNERSERSDAADKNDTAQIDSKNDKDDRGKKNSESRRDRRKRNEPNPAKSSNTKNAQRDSAEDSHANTFYDDTKGMSAEARAQKDRSIVTNMRNKDRPSLQIYQPGKRRGPESQNDDMVVEKPSSSGKSSDRGSDRKRSEAKESCDDRKKQTNEKKISRYSEKRNKVKEKRDLSDLPANNESNSNNIETTDEVC